MLVNKKYEANCFLKMFPDTGKSSDGLNTGQRNVSTGIIGSCPGCSRPHTAHCKDQQS